MTDPDKTPAPKRRTIIWLVTVIVVTMLGLLVAGTLLNRTAEAAVATHTAASRATQTGLVEAKTATFVARQAGQADAIARDLAEAKAKWNDKGSDNYDVDISYSTIWCSLGTDSVVTLQVRNGHVGAFPTKPLVSDIGCLTEKSILDYLPPGVFDTIDSNIPPKGYCIDDLYVLFDQEYGYPVTLNWSSSQCTDMDLSMDLRNFKPVSP